MVQLEIIEESPVTLSEMRDELERIKVRDKELNFRGARAEEHLQQFATLDIKKAKELSKKIEALEVPRLKAIHITKIVDVLPKTVEELKVAIQGYTLTISGDNLKKIVELTTQYQPKK
jgi:DNA-directed RNA polymerase subunit F